MWRFISSSFELWIFMTTFLEKVFLIECHLCWNRPLLLLYFFAVMITWFFNSLIFRAIFYWFCFSRTFQLINFLFYLANIFCIVFNKFYYNSSISVRALVSANFINTAIIRLSCRFEWPHFMKRTQTWTRTFRKSGHRTFRKKRTLYQNLLYELKTHFLTNSRGLISNMTIVFLNSSPKIPK